MKAVHILTHGMYCSQCPPRIEKTVEHLRGVKVARAYRSMALTSVLYDPDLVDPETIEASIENAGFDAHVLGCGRIR